MSATGGSGKPPLVKATCPGCRKPLIIPAGLLSGYVRCQHCGQIVRMGNPPSAPPSEPREFATPAGDDSPAPRLFDIAGSRRANSFSATLSQLRRRRRIIRTIGAIVLPVLLLGSIGLAGLLWPNQFKDVVQGIGRAFAPANNAGGGDSSDQHAADDENTPAKAAVKPARASAAFPRRALLIGVNNYLYASPLNPTRGAGEDGSDPLGLSALRRILVGHTNFHSSQVAELSDMAPRNPYAPTKAAIQDAVVRFLETSRPQDRILLAFTGHAAEISGTGYLVPIEGEPAKPETLIAISWLHERLAQCKARQKLLMLDIAHRQSPSHAGPLGIVSEPLSAKLEAQLKTPADGVQVWVACSGGEFNYESSAGNGPASIFLHYVVQTGNELQTPNARRALAQRLRLPEGKWEDRPEMPLPIGRLAADINAAVADHVRDHSGTTQTPQLFGKEASGPDPTPHDQAAPPVALKIPEAKERADARLVAKLVQELRLSQSKNWQLAFEALAGKGLEPYRADAAEKSPLRSAVQEALNVLARSERPLRTSFLFPGDDATFKKYLTDEQHEPARAYAALQDAIANLENADKNRADETSRRWQAHYDYVLARLLAQTLRVQEYNAVLGQMKKEIPPRKKSASTGWILVPQEKLQQKETRDLDKRRQTVLEKLIKEHPGTPWEILARRERLMRLGVTPQEAKITE